MPPSAGLHTSELSADSADPIEIERVEQVADRRPESLLLAIVWLVASTVVSVVAVVRATRLAGEFRSGRE